MDLVRQHFYEVSLEYVFKVQEVQERKMFEFVEPVSSCLLPSEPPNSTAQILLFLVNAQSQILEGES